MQRRLPPNGNDALAVASSGISRNDSDVAGFASSRIRDLVDRTLERIRYIQVAGSAEDQAVDSSQAVGSELDQIATAVGIVDRALIGRGGRNAPKDATSSTGVVASKFAGMRCNLDAPNSVRRSPRPECKSGQGCGAKRPRRAQTPVPVEAKEAIIARSFRHPRVKRANKDVPGRGVGVQAFRLADILGERGKTLNVNQLRALLGAGPAKGRKSSVKNKTVRQESSRSAKPSSDQSYEIECLPSCLDPAECCRSGQRWPKRLSTALQFRRKQSNLGAKLFDLFVACLQQRSDLFFLKTSRMCFGQLISQPRPRSPTPARPAPCNPGRELAHEIRVSLDDFTGTQI
jgi:hypothetical protein